MGCGLIRERNLKFEFRGITLRTIYYLRNFDTKIIEIGLGVGAGQLSKERGCFLPNFLRTLRSLNRMTDINNRLTKRFRLLNCVHPPRMNSRCKL